jgi:branched-chain amino acid aminotransferase
MSEAMEQSVAENKRTGDGYIRALVTRGPGSLGLDPRKTTPQIIIIVDDISLFPRENYEKGLAIVSVPTIRNHPNAINPRIKSLNYLNSIIAKMEALQANCVEALMINHKGEVAEGTGDNIFIVKQGVLKTPPPDAGILEGITRGAIMELARANNIVVQESTMTRYDVYTADECFLTGTAAEVIPVVKCDGHPIGDGKPGVMTKRLRDLFQQMVRE